MATGLTDEIPLRLPAEQAGNGLRKFEHSIVEGRIARVLSSGAMGSFSGQRLDFVITKTGRLVVGRGHSVLSDGESVLFAGELKFDKNGSVVEITNNSGHYRTNAGAGLTTKAMEFLLSIGVKVSKAQVRERDVN